MPTKITFVGGGTVEVAPELEEVNGQLNAGHGGRVRFESRLGGHVYVVPASIAYMEPGKSRTAGF